MNFLEKALNFIFPPACGICGRISNNYLCDKCRNNLICSKMYFNQLEDYTNNDKKFIDEHFYIFSYTGIIREKILQYKFNDRAYLANTISEFFINNEKLCGFLQKYDIMIAVPISFSRKRERGYNQSELIARKIGEAKMICFDNSILQKVKNNKPQSRIHYEQRLQNVKDVYNVQNEQKIQEKSIILFDDIYTTGATANECARVLKQAGAKKVGALTIAKDFKK